MIRQANINDICEVEYIGKTFANIFTSLTELREDFLNNPFSKYIVFIRDNDIIGFTNYLIAYEKSEIVNIVVKYDFRKNGVGNQMLNYVIEDIIKHKCENITLEVRKSNSAALKLYKNNGFIEKAIRKNYYKEEDGILMEKKLVI
jgi:[ribosomal protein S18]-alanine N-acetyltransferase